MNIRVVVIHGTESLIPSAIDRDNRVPSAAAGAQGQLYEDRYPGWVQPRRQLLSSDHLAVNGVETYHEADVILSLGLLTSSSRSVLT